MLQLTRSNMEQPLRCLFLSSAVAVLFLTAEGFGFASPKPNNNGLFQGYLVGFWPQAKRQLAEKEACSERGRKTFFIKLRNKLCDLDDNFVRRFMDDLCFYRGEMLRHWMVALFDEDKNGEVHVYEVMSK